MWKHARHEQSRTEQQRGPPPPPLSLPFRFRHKKIRVKLKSIKKFHQSKKETDNKESYYPCAY